MLLDGDRRFVLAREPDGYESNPELEHELERALEDEPYPMTEEVFARICQGPPAHA